MLTRSSFLLSALIGAASAPALAQSERPSPGSDHVAWVERCLRRMETIKPDMTRSQLLDVFKTEGGLSTGFHRTFVSQDCPYFKVDVDFKPVGRPERDSEGRVTFEEDALDIIVSVSRPYLQFTIAD